MHVFEGTVMQIEKAPTNDLLRVSKFPWKFRILIICNFGVIYPWNLLFKTRATMNAKTSVFVIYVEAIIYLLL